MFVPLELLTLCFRSTTGAKPAITLAAGGRCLKEGLVRHAPAKFRCREGKTDIPVSLKAGGGAVYLVASHPLAPLAASCEGSVVTVTSADVDIMIPIAVTLPGDKPRAGVVREGRWIGDFGKPAENAQILNLATGETVSARPARTR